MLDLYSDGSMAGAAQLWAALDFRLRGYIICTKTIHRSNCKARPALLSEPSSLFSILATACTNSPNTEFYTGRDQGPCTHNERQSCRITSSVVGNSSWDGMLGIGKQSEKVRGVGRNLKDKIWICKNIVTHPLPAGEVAGSILKKKHGHPSLR